MKILCFGGSLNGEVADEVSDEIRSFSCPVKTKDGVRWETYSKFDFFFSLPCDPSLNTVASCWVLDGYPPYRMGDATSFIVFLALFCKGYR